MLAYGFGKRLLDITVALTVLALLALPLLIIALIIPRKLGPGGPFFRQVRPGLHGRPFSVIKFRTMREAYGADGQPLSDPDRTPQFGWFLRRHSIDELPQLINVLRGEMSLVGPRPLLMEYLDRYPPQDRRRHDVLPGITGWAQVNGRDFATFKQRLEMDVWYAERRSMLLDVRILLRTLRLVLVRPQIAPLDQTMEEVDDLGLHPATVRDATQRDGRNAS